MAGYMVIGNAITNQGNNTITFLCDIDSDIITTVATDADAGDISISVNLNDSNDYVATTDYIYISDGINTDFILAAGFDITDEPDTINLSAGLINSYSAGSSVLTVEQITYDLDGTTLRRNDQPLAENIEDLQISPSGTSTSINVSFNVSLIARTSKPDPDYTDPTYGDHYRRYTLTSAITPRNLDL